MAEYARLSEERLRIITGFNDATEPTVKRELITAMEENTAALKILLRDIRREGK